MPSPNCSRCEGRTFAASPQSMGERKERFLLVYCTNCGAVAGAIATAA